LADAVPAGGVKITRLDLELARDTTVPDLIGEQVRLLFVGINPGLRSAAVQAHFAPRGNRFFPSLARAGITDRVIDASDGLATADQAYLLDRGVGITNLVARASAQASELGAAELAEGARTVEAKVKAWQPRVVAVLGVTAYRQAFARPRAALGPQPEGLGEAELWVVPNPSGRNAHATLESLARDYRNVARAAGIALV
jgi:TDG/mug DNA glycosylase family protein